MLEAFQIIVLLFSAVAHEYMHGWAAHRLGDDTAKNAGRLTFNPIAHLDWFGSILLPAVMIISRIPLLFAWAKPVPYNPYNLRDRKYGDAKVALAGPAANFVIAVFFGLIIRLFPGASLTFLSLLAIIVQINLMLMVFNLVPIPPLDGSKILASFLPPAWRERYLHLERTGFILVILFVMMGYELIVPIINWLFTAIVGI